jgi:sulfatase modifying factor 1
MFAQFGNAASPPDDANYTGSKWKGTSPVRAYGPNSFGLYDMAGNVWEWVVDWYDRDYYTTLQAGKPPEDPHGPDFGTGLRVLRGGGFDAEVRYLRTSRRLGGEPAVRSGHFSFRCVREVVP